MKKKLFCKRKREKRKSSSRACSLLAKKQRNKRWHFAGLSVKAAAQICVYAGIFLRALCNRKSGRHDLDFRIAPYSLQNGANGSLQKMPNELKDEWSVARDDAMEYRSW